MMRQKDIVIGIVVGIIATLAFVTAYPAVFGLAPVSALADQLAR